MELNKKNIRLIGGIILLVLLLVAVFQNAASVKVGFLMMRIESPLFVVILLSAGLGFGLGWLLRGRRR